MQTLCNGFLLDEQSGDFVSDDGRKIAYHNARFYDIERKNLFKARIPDGVSLPQPNQNCSLVFDVLAGERFCRLQYCGVRK